MQWEIVGFTTSYILKVFLLEVWQFWLFLVVPLVGLALTLTIYLRGSWELRTADFYTIRKLYYAVFLLACCLGGLSNWFVDYT